MAAFLSVLNRLFSWVPAPARLPTLAGIIVFVVAIGTTQVALILENRETDRLTERLAGVYLDGLAASVTDPVRKGDWPEAERRLNAAFAEQAGVKELGLFVVDSEGRPVAVAATGQALTLPANHFTGAPEIYSLSSTGDVAWASRPLTTGQSHRLIVALDLAPVLEARRKVLWTVVTLDLVIAGLCASLTSFLLQRVNRPTAILVALMEDAARGLRRRIPAPVIAVANEGVRSVFATYNSMVDGLVERERLRAEIAERSQTAALGRLAATMAHEVRNPLAGLSTAVATLRKFGDDSAARTESIDFLARGIEQLDAITTSMLNVYRPEEVRRLTCADFEDMRVLVGPVARRKEITLDWRVDLPESFSVSATGVRQVLLNLLLNACAASQRGGTVGLKADVENDHLVCVVSDTGPGMSSDRIAQLTNAVPSGVSVTQLGLDTVVSLLGNLEASASVDSRPGGGTSVRISIPRAEP